MPALDLQLKPGKPWPLGADWDGQGINFAVFSAHARAIELCLFDAQGLKQVASVRLTKSADDVWHGYLRGAARGLIYGYRAHGVWDPAQGHRFDPSKILLDPYARKIVGDVSQGFKAEVVSDTYDWGDDQAPCTSIHETVLYELHVKGFSMLNEVLPKALRGSFAGLAHETSVDYLQQLGITAVSLLPVHFHVDEERLANLGLSNYWGYNTLGFFAAQPRLASSDQGCNARDEFREMVRSLHAAGIEVILDVVFNHSAESDEHGPSLSFRGLDNASYYRLPLEDLASYENLSGCGNTLDIRQPVVLRLVMDSLRYWVEHMHVDGFRFDLAPVLGRSGQGFSNQAAFFSSLAQDPVLSRIKLIAEPWDIGSQGYQLGNFPKPWFEWNDRYRDEMRSFWIQATGTSPTRAGFAQRLCGSADVFQARGRLPTASVNFVTAHDGFCLSDLVSYEAKHNLANGEGNRDGHGHNLSRNCGVEGDTSRHEVLAERGRLQRAMLATLLLSQGTPMLCAGDEMGKTQRGNNNAYCQDNDLSWVVWSSMDTALLQFVSQVIALRKRLPVLRHAEWFAEANPGEGERADSRPSLRWLKSNAQPMQSSDWHDRHDLCLAGVFDRASKRGGSDEAVCAEQSSIVLLVNPSREPRHFHLPEGAWRVLLNSAEARSALDPALTQQQVLAPPQSIMLLEGA